MIQIFHGWALGIVKYIPLKLIKGPLKKITDCYANGHKTALSAVGLINGHLRRIDTKGHKVFRQKRIKNLGQKISSRH